MNASRWIPVGLTAIVMVTTLHAPAQQRIRQRPAATAPIQVKATSQKALPKAPLLNRETLAQIADAAMLPKNTSRTERRSIATVVGLLTKGDYDNALAEWKKAAAAYTKRTHQSDTNALIHHALREAYIETNKDLKFYADKLKFSNEKKKIAFAYRDELRAHSTRDDRRHTHQQLLSARHITLSVSLKATGRPITIQSKALSPTTALCREAPVHQS